jgi:hypothetical protein
MIRNPYRNDGVVKNTASVRRPFSRLESYPSGADISDERRAEQFESLEFVMTLSALPGTINHQYFENAEPIAEVDWDVPTYQGAIILYEDNSSGPGNIRGPPPGRPTFYGVLAHTRASDNQNLQITELMEALGINDYSSGSNGLAFEKDDQFQITGLNHIGKAVLAVANTYLPGDFAIPNQPQILTTEEFSELKPEQQYDYVKGFYQQED